MNADPSCWLSHQAPLAASDAWTVGRRPRLHTLALRSRLSLLYVLPEGFPGLLVNAGVHHSRQGKGSAAWSCSPHVSTAAN